MMLAVQQLHEKGFTLVELLLVVSLIAVLSGFLIPSFANYIDSQNIVQAAETLKSDLRSAQNRALTGVDAASGVTNYWGIKIPSQNASYYYTFKSNANNQAACDGINLTGSIKSEVLLGKVIIKDSANACVFFSMKNGDASFQNNSGNTLFKLGYADQTACKGIDVNEVGMMRTKSLCP